MSGKRKNYNPAYRREAARLVIETGQPIAHVAKEIGSVSRCWGAGWRSSGPGPSSRRRRWMLMSGPSWPG